MTDARSPLKKSFHSSYHVNGGGVSIVRFVIRLVICIRNKKFKKKKGGKMRKRGKGEKRGKKEEGGKGKLEIIIRHVS